MIDGKKILFMMKTAMDLRYMQGYIDGLESNGLVVERQHVCLANKRKGVKLPPGPPIKIKEVKQNGL